MAEPWILFGLPQCDRCRATMKWLRTQGLEVRFVDLRATPPERTTVSAWLDQVGSVALVNRRSRTFRQLAPPEEVLQNRQSLIDLLVENPLLIQRPVLIRGKTLVVGFRAERDQALVIGD